MVAVLNSSLARSSRVALAALVAVTLVVVRHAADRSASRATPRCTQNYDLAVAEYTKLLRENPDSREARQGLERAKLRASQDHFTTARRLAADRQARRGAGRVPARRRAQSRQRRHRARAAGHAHAAARQDRRSRRRQDAARIADRAEPRGAAARRRPARPTRSCPTRWCSATPARATSTPRSASSRTSAWCSIRPSAISRCRSTCAARRSTRRSTSLSPTTRNFWRVTGAAHASRSCPTPPPSAASTKKRSSARST